MHLQPSDDFFVLFSGLFTLASLHGNNVICVMSFRVANLKGKQVPSAYVFKIATKLLVGVGKIPYEDCSSVQKLAAGYAAVHYPYGKVNFLIDKTI